MNCCPMKFTDVSHSYSCVTLEENCWSKYSTNWKSLVPLSEYSVVKRLPSNSTDTCRCFPFQCVLFSLFSLFPVEWFNSWFMWTCLWPAPPLGLPSRVDCPDLLRLSPVGMNTQVISVFPPRRKHLVNCWSLILSRHIKIVRYAISQTMRPLWVIATDAI